MKKIIVLVITTLTLAACTNNGKANLEGKWEITSKPQWVENAYLAYGNDIYEFKSDGNCMFGTATGTYEITEDYSIKVNFHMQKATPGYAGVLKFDVKDDILTLTNSNESEPIILKKIE